MENSVQLTSVHARVLEKQYAKMFPLDVQKAKTRFKEIGIDMFGLDERIEYLKKYGSHCLSFSAFQPNMHFFDISGIGYIAYVKKWGTRFVLADPVCSDDDREYLVGEFLKDKANTAFIQISEPFADFLHDKFGLYATQFGTESIVDLKNWDLAGKKKQVLRTSINKARKDGVRFLEMNGKNDDDELTKEWLRTRKVRRKEVVFLIRPRNQEYQEGTRRFYAFLGSELLGFIHFDPVYKNGKIIAYVPNISRFSPKFKQGIFYPLMVHAMETFQSEGIPYLYLGLSPLAVADENKTCESGIVKWMIHLLYKYGNILYSFKGLHFTKSRFLGTEVKTFCAHREWLPAKSFLTVFWISNII
jgi:lysylphosphatidylglycerol synthetase-like protein (DUF2156 family)